MLSNNISKTEVAVLILIFILLFIGFVLVFTNVPLFEQYIGENGWIEWITVIGLLTASSDFFIAFIILTGCILCF